MSPNLSKFRTGSEVPERECGMDDHLGHHAAGPKLTEMVSAIDPRLATAYGQTLDPESSGAGAARAKRNLADDVSTYGEMEAN